MAELELAAKERKRRDKEDKDAQDEKEKRDRSEREKRLASERDRLEKEKERYQLAFCLTRCLLVRRLETARKTKEDDDKRYLERLENIKKQREEEEKKELYPPRSVAILRFFDNTQGSY